MSLRSTIMFATASAGMFLSVAANLQAQQPDPLGASLGLTPDNKSIPIWTQPSGEATQQIGIAAKNIESAVMLVGNPSFKTPEGIKWSIGTAFVISRKNRLLATNAHVGDIFTEAGGKMYAVRNGTSVIYTIDHAPWYHPAVKRQGHDGLLHQEADPANGNVFPWSADVAVLHVAEGPELPAEVTFATADELNCDFQSIGLMGYPSYSVVGGSFDEFKWPDTDHSERAVADFRTGVINRMTDFRNRASAPPADLQYIHHSSETWAGMSGSPMFLPNGHVVGLNNSGAQSLDQNTGKSVKLSYGVRIDCLWELLVYHKLDGLVTIPVDKSTLQLDRHFRPDPDDLALNQKVEQLIRESDELARAEKYDEALEKCGEAIDLAPAHAATYDQRCRVYQNLVSSVQKSKGVNQHPKLLEVSSKALEDAANAMKLAPSDRSTYLVVAIAKLGVTLSKTGTFKDPDAEELLTKILEEDDGSDPEFRSEAFRFRGQARGYDDAALADMNEAIRLTPYDWKAYDHRARYWSARDDAKAADDDRRAAELRTAELNAHRAFFLATSPDPAQRNGAEAVRLAKLACDATNYEYSRWLGALAASYAEMGDFDRAVELETKVVGLSPVSLRSIARGRLELYKTHKPYRG